MPVLVVDFYEGYGFKVTRPAADYDYFYSIVDKSLVGSPEEKSSSRHYRIRVSISNERFRTWDRLEYRNNDSWLKIPYEFAKRYVSEKLKNGELNEYEELEINSQNSPQDECPYDSERISPKGQWKFEVNITRKAQERILAGFQRDKKGVNMSVKQKKPMKFETIFDIYTASGIIGEGGTGTVYEVKDEAGNVYAVKTLDPQKATKEKLKRFKNECSFCSKNQHANVLTVIDHGLRIDGEKRIPFFVMPRYDDSLRKLISSGIRCQDALPFFGQILNGVEAAHLVKAIHRDLKPENILVNLQQMCLVIADFGIAHFAEEDLLTVVETAPQTRLANFQYAAPEQRKPGLSVDHRTDIYALGLMLNEMFTGEVPQGTNYRTISQVNPEFGYLDRLVSRMISQSPTDRPSSIAEIKSELIAHKNEFITQQRLSELKKTVIPVTEIDDPLISDPPSLTGVDWENNILTLKLSRPVNDMWKFALLNMGSYTSAMGKRPEKFSIRDDTATISAYDYDAQSIIDYFKELLPKINFVYKNRVMSMIREKEERERQRLQQELQRTQQAIAQQERRERLLTNLKI